MSDEDEYDDDMPRFGMVSVPSSLVAAIENSVRAQELHTMKNEVALNSLHELIDESGPERLSTLLYMLAMCMSDNEYTARLYGNVETVYRIKYPSHCPRCGVIHLPHADEVMPEPPKEEEAVEELPGNFYDDYSVMPVEGGKVECTICHGYQWISLKDRMMKPEGMDGCPNCLNRQGHG